MNMPRPDDGSREFFRTVLPPDPLVQSRPMFGNLAAFVNGNMFAGLFGDRLFVRLPPDARAELLACDGAGPFEPMPGRPMTEYVMLPEAWRGEPPTARSWMLRSFQWASELPPKEKKEGKSRRKAGG
jgi:TfoX/Sxy family transcriptional regulator of competence genes